MFLGALNSRNIHWTSSLQTGRCRNIKLGGGGVRTITTDLNLELHGKKLCEMLKTQVHGFLTASSIFHVNQRSGVLI